MLKNVPSLDLLIHEFGKLPGIGPKTAQRLAYHVLRNADSNVEPLRDALRRVRENVHSCTVCFSYTELSEVCSICSDPHRREDVLCIVEDPSDIGRIDSSGAFRGKYHVLHGTLSPLDGIGPDDLRIPELLERIRASQTETSPGIKEIILALDADLEGDTTVLYLAKLLVEQDIKITRIAHGVPIGGDIDYIDDRTLGKAIENRIQV